jgi:O-antigen/teichoic acid export membrane protein
MIIRTSRDFSARLGKHVFAESLRARLIRGVSWNLVGTIFNQGSTFLVNIILANVWGLHLFGEYAMVQTTLSVVTTMAQVSTGYTATKYVAEFRARDRKRAGRILALCGLVSIATATIAVLALLLASRWLAVEALSAPQLTPVLMVAAGLVFFSVTSGFLLGALAGLESYQALARAGIISGILYVILCWLGGAIGGLTGAVGAQALSAAIACALLTRFVITEAAKQGIEFRWRDASQEADVLVKFALPAALNSFVALPAIWLANAILARQPHGYDQLALFAAANNFRIIVLFVPQIMNNVGMSLLNNERGAENAASCRRIFWTNLFLTIGVTLAAAGALVVAGPWILQIFGSRFGDGYRVLVVLMIAAVPEAIAFATVQPMLAHERLWLVFFGRVLPCHLTLLAVAWLLAPSLGAVGLALGWVAGWTIALLVDVTVVWRTGLWAAPKPVGVIGTAAVADRTW